MTQTGKTAANDKAAVPRAVRAATEKDGTIVGLGLHRWQMEVGGWRSGWAGMGGVGGSVGVYSLVFLYCLVGWLSWLSYSPRHGG